VSTRENTPKRTTTGGLHFLTLLLRPLHALFRGPLRNHFARTPGWVLLTTRGRRSGRPHEVPLPCARSEDTVIVISAYGERSDWMRNIRNDPEVTVTWDGRAVPARAEIIEDTVRKQALITENPFVGFLPLAVVHQVPGAALRLARPVAVALLRRFVTTRPVIVFHVDRAAEEPAPGR
jgi:deazaflavin-dependent oxidoreductase (nitroreductase family)